MGNEPTIKRVKPHSHKCACVDGSGAVCDCGAVVNGVAVEVAAPVHRPGAQFTALREAMENAAARGSPCQLIVGSTHVTVTYRGIKWFHTQISAGNQQYPLAIEEFEEIVANALGAGL